MKFNAYIAYKHIIIPANTLKYNKIMPFTGLPLTRPAGLRIIKKIGTVLKKLPSVPISVLCANFIFEIRLCIHSVKILARRVREL